jgi:hypothetical protein
MPSRFDRLTKLRAAGSGEPSSRSARFSINH